MNEDKLGSRPLRISLFFSAIIIISNFLIGINAPIVTTLVDEINFFDRIWRVVVGQVISIDYHDPMGSGPYQLGALLWHWLGPHYYVMRLAIALFSLSIAFCGCIVAQRTLARRADLALLFCVTLAFQLSAPAVFEFSPKNLGMGEFYNRLIMSGLAVLFLQTFGGRPILSTRENAIEVALSAFLLNIMFLTKISGFLLGLMILLAGCLLQGRTAHRILRLCAAVLLVTMITTIEFKAAGLELLPIIQDYALAAHVRLAYSFHDLARGVVSWPLVISMTLLVLFAVSQRLEEPRLEFKSIVLIIGTYAACQLSAYLLNIMFLTKISGFLLGLMILLAGCLLLGRTAHRLLSLCAAVLLVTTITTIEFKAGFFVSWPLVISLTLLVLIAVSQLLEEPRLEFKCTVLIIGTYAACQAALNVTNSSGPSWWLAPAAMASLAVCKDVKPVAWQSGRLESWWRRIAFSRLAKVSFRDAIPLLTFALVLVPHVLSSIAGIALGALVSFGIETPYVVTAGKGVSFRTYGPAAGYAKSVNDAVMAIASLNLDHEAILNLDHSNPFPVLFLAPPPKGNGIYRWSDLGFNGPQGAVLESQEVIGDACVVTIPERPVYSAVTAPLVDIVRSKLATDFVIVYQDQFWSIYRRTKDCATAPHL